MEDDKNNLWMSCNKGIFYVSKKDFFQKENNYLRCHVFGKEDGLKSLDCNGGLQPSGWKTKDGKMWFATSKGAAVIDPNNIKKNLIVPNVTIEKVLIDGKEIHLENDKKIKPGKGEIEISYTALSFSAPNKVLFRYKLEGYDKDWIEAGTRRTAYYTNIKNGKYEFKIKACNNDNIWNENGAMISFTILPHWYETVWFYIGILSLVAMIIYGLVRIRMKIIEAKSAVLEERTRLALEIHDTVAQGLSGIIMQLGAAKILPPEKNSLITEHIDKAITLARSSLDEAMNSIWALTIPTDSKKGLFNSLRDSINQLLSHDDTFLKMDCLGTEYEIPAEVQVNVLRIVKEAITNSVKHANPKTIEVKLYYNPESFILNIKDDGKGFDESELASKNSIKGLGLKSMRKRAASINANIIIKSSIGEGTEIVLKIPKNKAKNLFKRSFNDSVKKN